MRRALLLRCLWLALPSGGAGLAARRVRRAATTRVDATAGRDAAAVDVAAGPSRRAALALCVALAAAPAAHGAVMEEYAACGKLPRELFVRTPVLNATATFLVEAMGMKVVGTSPGEISVAFGPTALERPADFLPGVSSFDEDGGHFRFTLRQTPGGALPEAGDGLAYVQLALDNVRASTMMKYGGENLDAFGTIRVDAPGGFPLRIIIGDEIRERAMYAALSVSDISKSMKFYESLGMRRTKYPRARLLEGAFDPDPMKLGFFDPEPVYLNFCDDGFGILLLPTARPSLFGKFAKPVVGDIYGGIRVAAVAAAQGDAQTFTDPDGYKIDVGGPA